MDVSFLPPLGSDAPCLTSCQILRKVLQGCQGSMLGTMALAACQFMEEPGMEVQVRESKHPYNNNTNFEVRPGRPVGWTCEGAESLLCAGGDCLPCVALALSGRPPLQTLGVPTPQSSDLGGGVHFSCGEVLAGNPQHLGQWVHMRAWAQSRPHWLPMTWPRHGGPRPSSHYPGVCSPSPLS